jgi:hypothetical protein
MTPTASPTEPTAPTSRRDRQSHEIALDDESCSFGRTSVVVPEQSSQHHAELEPRREEAARRWTDLDWPTAIWIGGIHLAALAAPFYFTWSGFWICMALYWVTGGLGVCLGYHRLLTHGSFTTYRPVRWLLPIIASTTSSAIRMAILIRPVMVVCGPTCSGCFPVIPETRWRRM